MDFSSNFTPKLNNAFVYVIAYFTVVVDGGSTCTTKSTGHYVCESTNPDIGLVSAIIIGSLVGLAIFVIILMCVISKCKRKKKKRTRPNRNNVMTVAEVDDYRYGPVPPPYAPPAYELHNFSNNTPLSVGIGGRNEPSAPSHNMAPPRTIMHPSPSANIGRPPPSVEITSHDDLNVEHPAPGAVGVRRGPSRLAVPSAFGVQQPASANVGPNTYPGIGQNQVLARNDSYSSILESESGENTGMPPPY